MMDKNCPQSTEPPPSSSSTTINNNNNNDKDHHQFLKHVNKLSHKIAKPTKKPTLDNHHHHSNSILNNHPPLIHQTQSQPLNLHHHHQPPPPQQPPVYNINKNDFRDVVQKLTGSPAHERFNTPPPIQPPKSTSSRLQKIRPPPLPQLNSRPLNPQPPLSPLPPLPSVHAAAESPISAYMRYIQNSSFISPRWSNFSQPPQNGAPATSIQFPTPSPAFGCVPSPKSPYPSLFSPTTLGFQQFPLSPTVPSPRWKGI